MVLTLDHALESLGGFVNTQNAGPPSLVSDKLDSVGAREFAFLRNCLVMLSCWSGTAVIEVTICIFDLIKNNVFTPSTIMIKRFRALYLCLLTS